MIMASCLALQGTYACSGWNEPDPALAQACLRFILRHAPIEITVTGLIRPFKGLIMFLHKSAPFIMPNLRLTEVFGVQAVLGHVLPCAAGRRGRTRGLMSEAVAERLVDWLLGGFCGS